MRAGHATGYRPCETLGMSDTARIAVDVFEKARTHDRLEQLEAARQQDLLPYFRTLEGEAGPVVEMEGRETIMLGSNNYLGLTGDARVKQAARDALERYGTGLTGSRLLNGTTPLHEQLEEELAEWMQTEEAIVYTTGHQANVGRVVCDSTWHHWMDVNIEAIALADTTDWKKIKRYFQNLAVWLNPPGYSTSCFHVAVIASHFETVGFQEYALTASITELGSALRNHLHYHYGPCWVTEWVIEIFRDYKLYKKVLIPELRERIPDGLFDGPALEIEVLGRMVRATMEQAERIKRASGNVREAKVKPLPDAAAFFAEPVAEAAKTFVAQSVERCRTDTKQLREMLG